ncbi:MAG: diacylglycerol kinase family lipid kinase [Elusimicrobiota bacterium]|jgi:YegS/Rv2252/BmrU family lipid kinase|nr:diacylglycerol kinase family lipid kinase [Elusimicrobiota bacterium]
MEDIFIINPKSGVGGRLEELKTAVKTRFPRADIVLTRRAGHAKELAAQAAAEGRPRLIVCGGDGTINEAAQGLALSQTALGVIPLGSGNGLARELGAPLDNFAAACNNILTARPLRCDLGRANGEYFINLAGLGLEADIAAAFDERGKTGARGKWPYFKIGAREFFNYRAPRAAVEFDGGKTINLRPLTLVFSNGRQYGSGFKIAPRASFNDGFLDMTVVESQNIARLLLGLPNFFKEGLSPVEVRKFWRLKKAAVHIDGNFNYHIDGEPRRAKNLLEIETAPAAISLLMRG